MLCSDEQHERGLNYGACAVMAMPIRAPRNPLNCMQMARLGIRKETRARKVNFSGSVIRECHKSAMNIKFANMYQ